MDFFFHPDGIAVIGATDNSLRGGYHIVNNILGGYRGRVYPVNPRHDSILGLPCYPDVNSIPGNFDLAVYFIPAPFLPATIEECAVKGVKGIIVESAGFAETGSGGAELQRRCVALARRHNIRLWGPNCMGLLDGHSRHVYSFMYTDAWKTMMPPGNVSLVVQSGMLSATFLMMILEKGGMGISKLCSIGNKCDVHETELLEYLICDSHTDVVGLYIESLADARRFMDLCRSTEKPIVVLKGGRSPSGAEAAMSHTASMAGNDIITRHAFRQAGVIPAGGFHEMMDLLRGFSLTKDSRNDGGTAVITFSGGGGIVAADFLHDLNLPLARLAPRTREVLRTVFPSWMEPSNPIDLWPAAEKNGIDRVYSTVIDAVIHDEGVDSIILHVFSGRMESSSLKELSILKNTLSKPVVIWPVGAGDGHHRFKKEVEALGIPVFEEMERGIRFLAAAKGHYGKTAGTSGDHV
ncbi:MAG: CoA-binding protein [Deltaproteobacteria bacterium]|nr:CoA-binding protein [Deltaproteobacteria bacterium]